MFMFYMITLSISDVNPLAAFLYNKYGFDHFAWENSTKCGL